VLENAHGSRIMVEKIGFAEYRNGYSFLWKNSTEQKSMSWGSRVVKKKIGRKSWWRKILFFFLKWKEPGHMGVCFVEIRHGKNRWWKTFTACGNDSLEKKAMHFTWNEWGIWGC